MGRVRYVHELCLLVCLDLSPIKGRTWQLSRTRTTCTFCGCGCQLELNSLAEKKVVNVTTHGDAGVNQGSLCVKGRFGYDFIHHPDRLLHPMIKKLETWVESSWEEALSLVADRLREIKETYGPQAIGGISSSRATNARCSFWATAALSFVSSEVSPPPGHQSPLQTTWHCVW